MPIEPSTPSVDLSKFLDAVSASQKADDDAVNMAMDQFNATGSFPPGALVHLHSTTPLMTAREIANDSAEFKNTSQIDHSFGPDGSNLPQQIKDKRAALWDGGRGAAALDEFDGKLLAAMKSDHLNAGIEGYHTSQATSNVIVRTADGQTVCIGIGTFPPGSLSGAGTTSEHFRSKAEFDADGAEFKYTSEIDHTCGTDGGDLPPEIKAERERLWDGGKGAAALNEFDKALVDGMKQDNPNLVNPADRHDDRFDIDNFSSLPALDPTPNP